MNRKAIEKLYRTSKYFFFPLILVLFALIKADKGINLADTTYSLGNYRFFGESSGVWFLLTFVSNVVGKLMMLLPFGGTMLGMKVYTSLLIGVMGVIGYRFFLTKMPAWLAFISELAAIGLCWAPSVVLYHYLTYFLLSLGGILVFRGLAGSRDKCLVLAGVILGINGLVRFPNNGLEVLLIIPLIYYGIIEKTEKGKILKQACLCIVGYLAGFFAVLIGMMITFGTGAFGQMIEGVLGIQGSASDYTFGQMLSSIISAYLHGARWALFMLICSLMGIPFFLLYNGRLIKLRKIVYCLCIAFLFFVFYKWGMYNFKYYQKESALQWGVIVLLLSIGIDIWIIVSDRMNNDWKLIGAISLVIIIITPLGSNNHIWPLLNNLFLVFPVTAWVVYKFTRWGRAYLDYTNKVPLFAFKAMMSAALIMFVIQAVGVGAAYVFVEGENGESIRYVVNDNKILKGMKTTEFNAENLSGLSGYLLKNENEFSGKSLMIYGNMPGLSYILDRPSALNTTWSDLASNPVQDMENAINAIDGSDISKRPLVIVSKQLYDTPENSVKFNMIEKFINNNAYELGYLNDEFVVFK